MEAGYTPPPPSHYTVVQTRFFGIEAEGERIGYVRTLIQGDGESRSIEAVTPGQYL